MCALYACAFPSPRFPLFWKRTNSPTNVQELGQRLLANARWIQNRWIQVLYCERRSAEIYTLKWSEIYWMYLLARAATGQVAFRGYARLVRVRQLRQIMPSSFASVRWHPVDRTPVRHKILKPTPQIFGVTLTKCTLANTLRYLTITPRARMGSESIAHSAFGFMGYWLRGHKE